MFTPLKLGYGMLFLVGGSADKCVAEFVDLAGGVDARVLIIPFASGEPAEAAANLKEQLSKLGVTFIDVAQPGQPLVIAHGTTAVFMTGGDQSRLVELLSKSDRARLRRFLRKGGIIAGTSAGAAAAGVFMITGGTVDSELKSTLTSARGLALTHGIIVDTHFAQRNRQNRLVAATWQYPRSVGIGLDEDTAVIIDRRGFATVCGVGQVWFYKAPANARASRGSLQRAKQVTRVTTLSAGQSFNLKK